MMLGQQPSNIFLRWKFHLEMIALERINKHLVRKSAAKVSKKKLRTNHLQPEPPIEHETPWASPSRPSYLMNAASVHFQIPKKIFPGVFLMDFFSSKIARCLLWTVIQIIFSPYLLKESLCFAKHSWAEHIPKFSGWSGAGKKMEGLGRAFL